MTKMPDKVEDSLKNAAGAVSETSNISFVRALPVIIGMIVVFALCEFLKDTFLPNLTRLQTNTASIFLVALISTLFVLWFNQTTKKKNQEIKSINSELLQEIIMRNRTEERLNYLNFHDKLTGLYNRAFFEEQIQRFSAARYSPVSILVYDVDGLKFINDTLGHDVGDSFLVTVANVIKDSFREGDVVARTGGDEFALLIPNSNEAVVKNTNSKILAAIKAYNNENSKMPISISVGRATSHNGLDVSDLFKEADNNMYREKLHRSQSARSAIVQTLKKALGARDFITEGHADRMQNLVTDLAKTINLPERKLADLRLLAQFHDIGKVGIPDSILFKPGPLTDEEYTEMKRHCEIGQIIAMSPPDLVPIADFILKHHEWWNGEGYPLGLREEQIPLECRILAVADAFDAMTSDRPYREAMSNVDALKELKRCSGAQFDPVLVNEFVGLVGRQGMAEPDLLLH
jgi:diguanylate cyclase (GGDEF)-like protein